MIEQLQAAAGRNVSRETFDRVSRYVELVTQESRNQNLVSAATIGDEMWTRHVLDSAQLLPLAPARAASWVDIGSGAGFPGMIVALLSEIAITLVEPRRLRAEFLQRTAAELGLSERLTVVAAKAARIDGQYDVITARAVAPLSDLLGMAHHLSHAQTVWLLPKGRNAKSELAEAQRSWHCHAIGKPSITDPQATVIVLSKVGAKSRR
jgi:16S rRNA (guanine527-N7)-methyltransferase